MRNLLWLAVLLPGLAGCTNTLEAYWQKPTRYKSLPHNGEEPAVAALVLDGSRRLVISQLSPSPAIGGTGPAFDGQVGSGSVNGSASRFTCPEPPPDAVLSTLIESARTLQRGELSASDKESLAITAQAIANRTSTVEVWRTTSSMYCVLLMNGAHQAAAAYLTSAAGALARTNDVTAATGLSATAVQTMIDAALKKHDEAAAQAAEKKRCDDLAADKRAADAKCKAIGAG